MKKLLVLFSLLCLALPCFAVPDWVQLDTKLWVDANSIKTYNQYGSTYKIFWNKILNPGNWELLKNKKIWYNMQNVQLNCTKKEFAVYSFATYDVKDNLIVSDTFKSLEYIPIVPSTLADAQYDFVCNGYTPYDNP